MSSGKLTNCRICDSARLEPVIDFGVQPWGNDFLSQDAVGKELFYPLRVVFCHDCTVAQLDYTVPKEVMFGDHTFLTGMTKTADEHFKGVAHEVDLLFFKDKKQKSALDIGSNDGTQLKHYKAFGYDVLGVEPSKRIAKIALDAGIPTVNEFFNADFVKKLGRKFDVINASGVFYHLEELHSVTRGIKDALNEGGVFVVQFVYMKKILDNCEFDQIYHEHLLYYTLQSLNFLLKKHGLEIFDAHPSQIHGGSIIAFASHECTRKQSERLQLLMQGEQNAELYKITPYVEFAKRIECMKVENLAFLERAKQDGKRIYGLGAPVKGNTLLNHFRIGRQYIDVLVEKNPLRKNLYSPGMHIPVVLEGDIVRHPDIYYVLAWNFKKEILERHKNLVEQGVIFYFPVDVKE